MSLKKLATQIKKETKAKNKTFEELFFATLDEYLLKSRTSKNMEREKRSRKAFRPSSYFKCQRNVWYFLNSAPKKGKTFPRTIRILEIGTAIHEWIQNKVFMDLGEDSSIKLLTLGEIPAYGQEGIEFVRDHSAPDMEFKFIDRRFTKVFPISAMIDGAGRFMNRDFICEFKSMKHEKFDMLIEPLPEHVKQGAIYALSLEISNVFFIYVDKNTQDWKGFLVTYEQKHLDWVKSRIASIEDSVLRGELPEKEESTMDCRYCAYKYLCDKDEAWVDECCLGGEEDVEEEDVDE